VSLAPELVPHPQWIRRYVVDLGRNHSGRTKAVDGGRTRLDLWKTAVEASQHRGEAAMAHRSGKLTNRGNGDEASLRPDL